MPALPSFLPGFRLVTGDALNAMISVINNLTGFGTSQPVSGTTGTFSGTVQSSGNIDTLVALTTNGAISPNTAANYVITKAGVLADTLAAPTAGTDDGKIILITSATANAHTLTATGLLQTGAGANANLATFAAQPGAGLSLMAYQAKWYVLSAVGITFS
jgi:hypothetical protein